jgi:hypothetical protein
VKVVGLIALACALFVPAVGLGAAAGSADDPPVPTLPTVTVPSDPTEPVPTEPVPTEPVPTVPDPTAPVATVPPPPAPTVPEIAWGAADDASKYAEDGGAWFYEQLKGANLTQNRWTVAFDPSNPTAINELPFLERAAPKAQEAGVRIILVLVAPEGCEGEGRCGPCVPRAARDVLRRDTRGRPGRECDRHGALAACVDAGVQRAARVPARPGQGVPLVRPHGADHGSTLRPPVPEPEQSDGRA